MALPIAMAGIPLYILAPDYYAKDLDLSLSKIGFALLFLRFLDAVTDPLIGVLSDKYFAKKNYIFALGIFLTAIGFFAIFNPQFNYFYWFIASAFLATLGFSIVTINLNAYGGVWSSDYNLKTKISTTREFFSLIGLIFAVILPAILKNFEVKNLYFSYSIIMLFLLFIIGGIFINFWLKKTNLPQPKIDFSWLEFFKSLHKKKAFFLVYFISIFASSIPAVLIIFFVRDNLNLEKYLGLFLMSYFLAAGLSMPFWNYISKRLNKINAWGLSMLIAICVFVWAANLEQGDFTPYLLICLLSGFAFGGELSLPPAILADLVDKNYTTDYSILAFLSKISLALASGISFMVLDENNFSTGKVNNSGSLELLSILYATIPCTIKFLAIILLIKFFRRFQNEKPNFNSNGGGYA
ncbi:MAG: MFS transporter [Rickettsiales bacterium]|nr:MFS transporter [Rickettsiales bacterium]